MQYQYSLDKNCRTCGSVVKLIGSVWQDSAGASDCPSTGDPHRVNDNCLSGIRCPNCRCAERFDIEARVVATVHDDGIETTRSTEWDDASLITCSNCSHGGSVEQFTVRAPSLSTPDDIDAFLAS